MDIELIKTKLWQEAEDEVKNNILKFWAEETVDHTNGGFLGSIEDNLAVDPKAAKGCVLNTRILWTYSKAYNLFKDPEYLALAKRAYEYIKMYFWDKENGGLYWTVDYLGNPDNTKKQIYAQAFGVYALSEYYMATKNKDVLNDAIALYKVIEEFSYDSENKGYFEAYTREWEVTEDLQLGADDMNEKKSMNTHLHILEAYTNLYRVWKDEDFRGKLDELIEITLEHIVDKETYRFKLFFDETWDSKSGVISYGHDIEGSWLLVEAAQVLGNADLLTRTKEIALGMAEVTYQEGIDQDGAVMNEMHEDGTLDKDRIWWVQAEAVVGFINAYEMTKEEHFLQAAYKTWDFTKQHVIDKENGEWFWNITADGKVKGGFVKVGTWKCPYHNSRACYEMIERMK